MTETKTIFFDPTWKFHSTFGSPPAVPTPDYDPPWAHLRGKAHPVPVFLNRLRREQYLSIFKQQLDVLRVLEIGKGTGWDLLMPEIRSELQEYSEEELLTTFVGLVVCARTLSISKWPTEWANDGSAECLPSNGPPTDTRVWRMSRQPRGYGSNS